MRKKEIKKLVADLHSELVMQRFHNNELKEHIEKLKKREAENEKKASEMLYELVKRGKCE